MKTFLYFLLSLFFSPAIGGKGKNGTNGNKPLITVGNMPFQKRDKRRLLKMEPVKTRFFTFQKRDKNGTRGAHGAVFRLRPHTCPIFRTHPGNGLKRCIVASAFTLSPGRAALNRFKIPLPWAQSGREGRKGAVVLPLCRIDKQLCIFLEIRSVMNLTKDNSYSINKTDSITVRLLRILWALNDFGWLRRNLGLHNGSYPNLSMREEPRKHWAFE